MDFVKGNQHILQLQSLQKMVYKSLDKKEINIGLFLYLSKAFDLVDHVILLRTMGMMGI
jgi:hypothetical protein